MMRSSILSTLIVLTGLAWMSSSAAAVVVYEVQGQVNYIGGPAIDGPVGSPLTSVLLGDTFTATYTVDENASDNEVIGRLASFDIASVVFTVGSSGPFTFANSVVPSSALQMLLCDSCNDINDIRKDFVVFDAPDFGQSTSSVLEGFAVERVFVELIADDSSVFPGPDAPSSPVTELDLPNFNTATFSMSLQKNGFNPDSAIKGNITSVSVSVVPVPAAIWLFGSALAGLGWMRRKKAA